MTKIVPRSRRRMAHLSACSESLVVLMQREWTIRTDLDGGQRNGSSGAPKSHPSDLTRAGRGDLRGACTPCASCRRAGPRRRRLVSGKRPSKERDAARREVETSRLLLTEVAERNKVSSRSSARSAARDRSTTSLLSSTLRPLERTQRVSPSSSYLLRSRRLLCLPRRL